MSTALVSQKAQSSSDRARRQGVPSHRPERPGLKRGSRSSKSTSRLPVHRTHRSSGHPHAQLNDERFFRLRGQRWPPVCPANRIRSPGCSTPPARQEAGRDGALVSERRIAAASAGQANQSACCWADSRKVITIRPLLCTPISPTLISAARRSPISPNGASTRRCSSKCARKGSCPEKEADPARPSRSVAKRDRAEAQGRRIFTTEAETRHTARPERNVECTIGEQRDGP